MKQFSSVVAKIKNGDGVYESIPALRGMSSYEVAKAAGFTGTEEEWLEFMFDDGWVAKFQELEANKANKSETYTKTETLSDDTKGLFGLTSTGTPDEAFAILDNKVEEAKNYQLPWNVDENVGQINLTTESLAVSSDNDGVINTKFIEIPMINSGEVYLRFGDFHYTSQDSYGKLSKLDNITVYINNVAVKTFATTTDVIDSLTLLSVNKGDIVKISFSAYIDRGSGSYSQTMTLRGIGLYANVDTAYKYTTLIPGQAVKLEGSIYEIEQLTDVLLGVNE